jgi:hypothetical protein
VCLFALRRTSTVSHVQGGVVHGGEFSSGLLLDSRVVNVLMAYDPPLVMLSSLKPLFFNSLKHKLRFSDHTGA